VSTPVSATNARPRFCAACGAPFEGPAHKLYCSRRCAKHATYQRHADKWRAYGRQRYQPVVQLPRACAWCAQPFTPSRSDQRYCSRRCYQRARRAAHLESQLEYQRAYRQRARTPEAGG
jgi:predicted nucleic acid-binding Zn ribbon protein